MFEKNFKEIFLSQLVSLAGGLIAGTVLAIYTDNLLLLPGMLILLPGFLEIRGSISGSFASRLSSGLFLGIINPDKKNTKLIRGNVYASFILASVVCFFLGIIAFLFTFFITGIVSVKLIFIPVLAGIFANAVEIPMTLAVTLFLFKKGHDPNNIMGPFVTSTGDVTSILSLLIALFIL